MRILLAVDGSVSSDCATQLVSSLPLPPDSLVRILAVHHGHAVVLPLSLTTGGREGSGLETDEQAGARHRREAIERCERLLGRPGLKVEGFVVQGRAASAIVDEARAMEADLIVVGSRGHGTIATMVLGSTASEVVDHASCPVLVARSNTLGPIAFADDGSPSARTAESLLIGWPIFAGECVSVVTVANLGVPVASYAPGLYPQALESYSETADQLLEDVRAESTTAADRLVAAGLYAQGIALEGDPAAELVRFATQRRTGTIVMGTRGHTGLTRIVLGSVARNVLLHAPCSVLVVREPKGA
jgi:nucleotide-binding universal stress UspA family protein